MGKQDKECIEARIKAIILEGLESRIGQLNATRGAAARPARGWLRAVREAMGLTQVEVAEKISIRRQSYAQLEAAEEEGAISLASLRRSAEAMDCELVYFLVPRGPASRTFTELAASHDPLATHSSASAHSMSLKSGPPPQ